MKLILKTHCTNEFFDGCSYAFLDLTRSLARTILQRKAIFDAISRNGPDLIETRYCRSDAVYFSGLPTTESAFFDEIEQKLSGRGFVQVPDNFSVSDGLLERKECDQMVLSRDGVWFACYPKHCDPLVETREIDFETVRLAEGDNAVPVE